jgi:hypothetical protein
MEVPKPVIAARLGATEFVIKDGVDGDLVSPGEHLYGHACEGADPRPVAATDASVVTVKSHEPI